MILNLDASVSNKQLTSHQSLWIFICIHIQSNPGMNFLDESDDEQLDAEFDAMTEEELKEVWREVEELKEMVLQCPNCRKAYNEYPEVMAAKKKEKMKNGDGKKAEAGKRAGATGSSSADEKDKQKVGKKAKVGKRCAAGVGEKANGPLEEVVQTPRKKSRKSQ